MLHREQGHRHPGHPPDLRSPHACTAHDQLGPNAAAGGLDGADPATADVEPGDLHAALETRTPRAGAIRHGLGGPDRSGDAVGRHLEAGEDRPGVHLRNQGLNFLGSEES
jgi:hypothetical protein